MYYYGRNPLLEALRTKYPIESITIDLGARKTEKIREIGILAENQNIPFSYQSRKNIDSLTGTSEHQGVAFKTTFKSKSFSEITRNNPDGRFMYISEAHYEHNVGAIIRSAEAAGFTGVILPKKMEITPTVTKVSTGAVFHIEICSESIFNAIKVAEDTGLFIFGIERDGENYTQANIAGPALFIIGGEDKSLSDAVRKKCNAILEIPQFGKVNSLNMSVAASIVMFEANRQINRD